MTFQQFIYPGWAVSPDLYKPYAALSGSENCLVHDYCFFTGSRTFQKPGMPPRKEGQGGTTESFIVTAHSMGGLFALSEAASRPEGIKALILFSPFASFVAHKEGSAGHPAAVVEQMKNQLLKNPSSLLKSFYRSVTYPARNKTPVPEYLNTEALAVGLDFLKETDMGEKIPLVDVPVLIIQGTKDKISTPDMAEYLSSKLPDSRMIRLENAGHAVPFTHARRCFEVIEKFIKGIFYPVER